MRRALIPASLVLVLFCLAGCYTTKVMIAPGKDLKSYQQAFLVLSNEDDLNLKGAVHEELARMGYQVKMARPEGFARGDLIVAFSYETFWEYVGYYVKSLQLLFIQANTGEVVAQGTFQKNSFHNFPRKEAVEYTFDKIKRRMNSLND